TVPGCTHTRSSPPGRGEITSTVTGRAAFDSSPRTCSPANAGFPRPTAYHAAVPAPAKTTRANTDHLRSHNNRRVMMRTLWLHLGSAVVLPLVLCVGVVNANHEPLTMQGTRKAAIIGVTQLANPMLINEPEA